MYNEEITFGDVMTVDEFVSCCRSGGFIDYDGYGHPVKGNLADWKIEICPSKRKRIPKDATHIVWFNR